VAVLRAAERFLVGYPEEADAFVVEGQTDVLDLIRTMEPGPSGIESTLVALASERNFAPLQGTIPLPTAGLLAEDTHRVADANVQWAALLMDEPFKPPDIGAEPGRVNGLTLAPQLPCDPGTVIWSVFMGHNGEAASLASYVADHLRWWHPGPTVRALVTPLHGEVEQFAWKENPEELEHWQVYVCVPWQVSLYAEDLVMVDSPEEW
jgi:hypothetical protein